MLIFVFLIDASKRPTKAKTSSSDSAVVKKENKVKKEKASTDEESEKGIFIPIFFILKYNRINKHHVLACVSLFRFLVLVIKHRKGHACVQKIYFGTLLCGYLFNLDTLL